MESRLEKIDELRGLAAERAMATQSRDFANSHARWEKPRTGDPVLRRRHELDTQ